MFIWGMDGRKWRSIAILISIFWLSGLCLIFVSSIKLSFVIITINILTTIAMAVLVFREKESIVFKTLIARDLAFPISEATGRLSLVIQLMGLAFVFIPSVALLIIKPEGINNVRIYLSLSFGYIVGMHALLGVILRVVVIMSEGKDSKHNK